MTLSTLQPLVSLAKRRGFVYSASEIYGGFANTYSYGPLGAQLKKTLRDLWWSSFVTQREDVVGLDGPILLHPKVWESSGHVDSFADALIDCKECKMRARVDHLVEAATGIDVEGMDLGEMDRIVEEHKIACPKCGSRSWTSARQFNLMFATSRGLTTSEVSAQDKVYLRPETAQAIFIEFKNVCESTRARLPFGIAQIGKAFRNEITPGNFIFRTVEFEQMEIEYFVEEKQWQEHFTSWLEAMKSWCHFIGLPQEKVVEAEHVAEKLSHYSKRTVDLQFDFPFGRSELYGLAYRTDFDLTAHQEASGKNLFYTDPHTKEKILPHVIEPTFGLDRTLLALLCSAYDEELLEEGQKRTVLRFKPFLAPIQVAVFPLMKKEELTSLARNTLKELLRAGLRVDYDEAGAIGKRYRRHDEIGTPFCVTIDYESLEEGSVTVRERDSMKQERLTLEELPQKLQELCRTPLLS